jgi:hypothetical protein
LLRVVRRTARLQRTFGFKKLQNKISYKCDQLLRLTMSRIVV